MIAPVIRLCGLRRRLTDRLVSIRLRDCAVQLPITPALACCALAFLASPSMAATPAAQDAKQPISTPADTTATSTQSPAATPAVIYVYRQRHISAAGEHPLIIVNFDALAELHNSNYAQRTVQPGLVIVGASPLYAGKRERLTVPEAPPGAVFVGESMTYAGIGFSYTARVRISPLPGFGLPKFLSPGPPQSFRECAGLDALRLGEAKQLQLPEVAHCIAALEGAENAVARILHGKITGENAVTPILHGEITGENKEELNRLCDIDPPMGHVTGMPETHLIASNWNTVGVRCEENSWR